MYRKTPQTSHRQSHFRNQMIALGVGLIVVVIYLAIFGLNSVINFSVWVGNAISGNKNAQEVESKEDFFGTLFVDSIEPATNSAQLIVSGSSSNYDNLTFEINGKKVKTTSVMNQDSFSEEIGELKPGKNTIQVIAEAKKEKKKKQSEVIEVTYKNTPPKLTVSEPANDSTTSSQEITVKGETDKGVNIEVNGAPTVVTTSGAFEAKVRLKEGDNTLTVLAIDDAGNEQKSEIKVKYQKD